MVLRGFKLRTWWNHGRNLFWVSQQTGLNRIWKYLSLAIYSFHKICSAPLWIQYWSKPKHSFKATDLRLLWVNDSPLCGYAQLASQINDHFPNHQNNIKPDPEINLGETNIKKQLPRSFGKPKERNNEYVECLRMWKVTSTLLHHSTNRHEVEPHLQTRCWQLLCCVCVSETFVYIVEANSASPDTELTAFI